MNELISTIVLPALSSMGSLCLIIYLFFKERKSGISDIEKKTIEGYKERNNQLEGPGGILPRLEQKIADITADFDKKFSEQKEYFQTKLSEQDRIIAKLTGTVEEKDKHIKSLTDILQGKNPELVNLLNEIKVLNVQIVSFLQTSHKETKDELLHQTDILKGGQIKNKKIDKASKDHKGVPVLVPVEIA